MVKHVVLLVAIVTLGVPAVSRAETSPEPPAVAACNESAGQVPEVGDGICRGVEQLGRATAQLCRHGGLPADVCAQLDGRPIRDDDIDQFEQSWVARALALQRALSSGVPLNLATLAHTHNSYNSAAYDPTLSGLDHNQLHTITDQLRMGVRAIEIDLHWAPNVWAGGQAPTTCHAEPVADPVVRAVVVHAGCTTEGTLREALEEISAWLAANPDEFVLLYLENVLDGDPDAHEVAAADIEATIGDRVLKPGTTCDDLPVGLSPADVVAAGEQVLITGNCGPGSWGEWVHPRGPTWWETSSGPGDDYPPAPDCAARGEREGDRDYDTHLIRFWEDSTWLSHTVSGHGSDVTPAEAASMARCGVNLVGFDLLRPNDGRLEALVWSWAPAEPTAAGGACAYRAGDGFHAGDCTEHRPFACWTSEGWAVTETSASWASGASACEAVQGTFAVPRTGQQDLALGHAAAGEQVWISYGLVSGTWVAGGPATGLPAGSA